MLYVLFGQKRICFFGNYGDPRWFSLKLGILLMVTFKIFSIQHLEISKFIVVSI